MPSRTAQEVFLERIREMIPLGESRDFARRAGLNEATLSRWRTGTLYPNPTLQTLVLVAAGLRVPLAYLISDGVYEPPFAADAVEKLMRATEELIRAAGQARRAVDDVMKKP